MNIPSTADMNRVIALFDGYEEYEDSDGTWFKKEGQITCMHIKLQNLEYHTDYNCLMSAWVRYRDLEFDSVNDQMTHSLYKDIGRLIAFEPIEVAHKALYDAITWYNSIKK